MKPQRLGACNTPHAFSRQARASFVLALIALAGGGVCIMGGQWPPGLILVFASVAGVMTAWQMRGRLSGAPPDDHAE